MDTEHHKLIEEKHVKAALFNDKGEEAKLSSWEIIDFTKKGDNYASIITSVSVNYQMHGHEEKVSYVVKINMGGGFEDFKPFNRALFWKETEFLDKILPALNSELTSIGHNALNLPKQLHYSLNNEDKEFLFLEDLRPRGFKMHDRKKGLDLTHANMVLREIARLHGASFVLQRKMSGDEITKQYPNLLRNWHNHSPNAESLFNMIFSSGFDGAAKMLNKVGGYEKAEKWLMTNKENCVGVFKRQVVPNEQFDVIAHGDCWNNNFLFRYDDDGTPAEVILLDLQLSQKSSLGNELNYFFYTSMTGDVRKPNIDNMLQTYYDTFTEVVKENNIHIPFTFGELKQEFIARHEYGLIFAASFSDTLVRPEEDTVDFKADSKEEFETLLEEFKASSLEMLDSNPLFKPRFLATFDEMMEHGTFD